MRRDILDLFNAPCTPHAPRVAPPVLSVWQPASYSVAFFTLSSEQFSCHYEDGFGSYLCPGEGCPACAAGLSPTEHLYLPVWDLLKARVAVLKLLTKPGGAAERVAAFVAAYQHQLADVMARVECRGNGVVTLTALQMPPDVDRGGRACKHFAEGLESGAVDLRDCCRRPGVEEIRGLPSVRQRLLLAGGNEVLPLPRPAPGPVAPQAAPGDVHAPVAAWGTGDASCGTLAALGGPDGTLPGTADSTPPSPQGPGGAGGQE